MTPRHAIPALLAAALLAACTATPSQQLTIVQHCHARDNGQLPDPACTPGALNPQVTQQTTRQTVCKPGWTKTVRPPVSYTSALKRRQIVQYGYTDRTPTRYEEDHLVSLELGGAPKDPRNLWPELGASPNPKDRAENLLHARVCAGKLSLADAQREIATDWTQIR